MTEKRLEIEMKEHLEAVILPYWKDLRDVEKGGYYGLVNYDLQVDKQADKGVILNSRILWFFSSSYLLLKEEELLLFGKWAFDFLINHCLDKEYGGVYWMMTYDRKVKEDVKYTYNQAFAVYALSAYYEATKEEKALHIAMELFYLIEKTCTDEYGYLESFTRDWKPIKNEKLSENGLTADKTMNTLLHVLEAYTCLYKVSREEKVGERLHAILDIFYKKVYNPVKGRLEVFFDEKMETITDLHSYGHDIESSWPLDEACKVSEEFYIRKDASKIIYETKKYTSILVQTILTTAMDGNSILNECFLGKIDKRKVWWVQAEAIVGFVNEYEKTGNEESLKAAHLIWEFIKEYMIDKRTGSEWYWDLDENNNPRSRKPITEPWKCPYHNGRMCLEIIRRNHV